MASTPSSSLGTLVRLRPLEPSHLPAHPDLETKQIAGDLPDLTTFLTDILAEAESFMTAYLPGAFKVKASSKSSPPSTASVELLSHELDKTDLPKGTRASGTGDSTGGEAWFARTSLHENTAKEGTATWEEFDAGLREDHSQHEMDYTPDVRDAHLVLDWRAQLAEHGNSLGGWGEVHAELREMLHHIPPPLNKRVFSVLVVTARKSEEFIVVQIPVQLRGVAGAKYADAPKVTAGEYVSIELGRLVEDGTRTKWQMATASDAKGVLPMWAQKMGVPGAVVKDVGLFIDWCAKQRSGKS